jgi:hypothetical protein
MMSQRLSAVFLIHLIQDVQVLRPLVFMAARDFGWDSRLLVSTRFSGRDALGIWRTELEEISARTNAPVEYFDNDWQAHQQLTAGRGLLFSASESSLANHRATHNVFRHAPANYLRVTLQHGFECVGFRHGAHHQQAHGPTASFGADVLCSWFDHERLTSMAPSQRAKVIVTGPTAVLQQPVGSPSRTAGAPGLVCENLHSVRFHGPGHPKREFMSTFEQFSKLMGKRKRRVTLRPHPGGQYFLKSKIALPDNVDIQNAPTYRLDLRQYSYGISAPSSVLIDLLLADIPTAVWQDRGGQMDAGNYEGLTTVSSARDWARFAQAAENDPEPFLSRQEQFLKRQQMPLEPQDVYSRFAQLFDAAAQMPAQ